MGLEIHCLPTSIFTPIQLSPDSPIPRETLYIPTLPQSLPEI